MAEAGGVGRRVRYARVSWMRKIMPMRRKIM